MSIYCLVLDKNYVAYAYCLALSVKRHVNNSRIRFNCVDDETPALLMSIGVSPEEIVPRSSLIPIEVAARQSEYALNEFCWRCKPLAVRRAMEEAAINEWVIYLDSDMLAFGDIDHHLENNSESDVCITPHRSSARFAHYDVSAGLYNAGFVAFRSNQRGAEALDWWDSRCSERCSMDPTDDTYADQKYLEHMEAKFDFVKSIIDAGLNAAPWNIENYEIRKDNSGQIRLDEANLCLYHFQGMQFISPKICEGYTGDLKLGKRARDYIYEPYLREIAKSYKHVRRSIPGYSGNFPRGAELAKTAYHVLRRRLNGNSNLILAARGAKG